MDNINNKNLNTSSSKLKKLSMLIQFTTNKISNNQAIKRMLKYQTKNPLSKRGIKYDGTKVDQPDITEDLIGSFIYDTGFNPEMVSEQSCSLYVNMKNGTFNKRTNSIYLEVNVIVPESVCRISEGYRQMEICQYVADLFDNIYVDSKDDADYYDDLGSLKFDLVSFESGRLSKTNNNIWCTMLFEIGLVPISRVR